MLKKIGDINESADKGGFSDKVINNTLIKNYTKRYGYINNEFRNDDIDEAIERISKDIKLTDDELAAFLISSDGRKLADSLSGDLDSNSLDLIKKSLTKFQQFCSKNDDWKMFFEKRINESSDPIIDVIVVMGGFDNEYDLINSVDFDKNLEATKNAIKDKNKEEIAKIWNIQLPEVDKFFGKFLNESMESNKTIEYNQLVTIWKDVYGENFGVEYSGLASKLKKMNKFTVDRLISEWKDSYGEDFDTEYKGAYDFMTKEIITENKNADTTKQIEDLIKKCGLDEYNVNFDNEDTLSFTKKDGTKSNKSDIIKKLSKMTEVIDSKYNGDNVDILVDENIFKITESKIKIDDAGLIKESSDNFNISDFCSDFEEEMGDSQEVTWEDVENYAYKNYGSKKIDDKEREEILKVLNQKGIIVTERGIKLNENFEEYYTSDELIKFLKDNNIIDDEGAKDIKSELKDKEAKDGGFDPDTFERLIAQYGNKELSKKWASRNLQESYDENFGEFYTGDELIKFIEKNGVKLTDADKQDITKYAEKNHNKMVASNIHNQLLGYMGYAFANKWLMMPSSDRNKMVNESSYMSINDYKKHLEELSDEDLKKEIETNLGINVDGLIDIDNDKDGYIEELVSNYKKSNNGRVSESAELDERIKNLILITDDGNKENFTKLSSLKKGDEFNYVGNLATITQDPSKYSDKIVAVWHGWRGDRVINIMNDGSVIQGLLRTNTKIDKNGKLNESAESVDKGDIEVGSTKLTWDSNLITLYSEMKKEESKYKDAIEYLDSFKSDYNNANRITLASLIMKSQGIHESKDPIGITIDDLNKFNALDIPKDKIPNNLYKTGNMNVKVYSKVLQDYLDKNDIKYTLINESIDLTDIIMEHQDETQILITMIHSLDLLFNDFHHNTRNFAKHKALGEIIDDLYELKDSTIEKIIGYTNVRYDNTTVGFEVSYSDTAISSLSKCLFDFAKSLMAFAKKYEYYDLENIAQGYHGLGAKLNYLLSLNESKKFFGTKILESKKIILKESDYSEDQRKELASKGEALPDGSFPIKNKEDLENAVKLAHFGKDPKEAKDFIKKRAKELELDELIPDNWINESFNYTDLQIGQKYDYSGGAEHLQVEYVGLTKDNKDTKIGAKFGDGGFLFKFTNDDNSYVQMDNPAMRKYLSIPTNESNDNESSMLDYVKNSLSSGTVASYINKDDYSTIDKVKASMIKKLTEKDRVYSIEGMKELAKECLSNLSEALLKDKGLETFKDGDLFGLKDSDGEIILEPVYSYIDDVITVNNMVMTKDKDGNKKLIDLSESLNEDKNDSVYLTNSNLSLWGSGRDGNGNSTVVLSYGSNPKFSIQTNDAELQKVKSILSGDADVTKLSDDQLDEIEKAVVSYIKQFGTKSQKDSLKVFNENIKPFKMNRIPTINEALDSALTANKLKRKEIAKAKNLLEGYKQLLFKSADSRFRKLNEDDFEKIDSILKKNDIEDIQSLNPAKNKDITEEVLSVFDDSKQLDVKFIKDVLVEAGLDEESANNMISTITAETKYSDLISLINTTLEGKEAKESVIQKLNAEYGDTDSNGNTNTDELNEEVEDQKYGEQIKWLADNLKTLHPTAEDFEWDGEELKLFDGIGKEIKTLKKSEITGLNEKKINENKTATHTCIKDIKNEDDALLVKQGDEVMWDKNDELITIISGSNPDMEVDFPVTDDQIKNPDSYFKEITK